MTERAHEKELSTLKAVIVSLCGEIVGPAAGEMRIARHERRQDSYRNYLPSIIVPGGEFG
jgi:hypothetical protein